jgi:hypothetical protein
MGARIVAAGLPVAHITVYLDMWAESIPIRTGTAIPSCNAGVITTFLRSTPTRESR